MTRRLGFAVVAAFGALLLASCDDECKKGTSQCLSTTLMRTCVEGEDENFWFVHECGEDERCDPEAAQNDGPADGGSSGAGAACVGTCAVGDSECVSPELARYCVDGKLWELDACSVGERCVGGSCRIGTDGGVQACVPGTQACANQLVQKICDSDGSGWVQRPCAASEICLDSECVPDPRSSCDDGNRCLDNRTALRCLGRDNGFSLVSCEGETWCEGGRCVGPNCAIGSTCVGLNQLRECSDGVNFVDTQCAANEVCRQDKDSASCVPRTCNPGTTVCGDPQDDSADPTTTYSQCIVGPNSGVPEWLHGSCSGALLCDPTFAGTGNPCRQACTPGAEMCAADPTTGVNDGYRVCQDDGTWGPVQTCNRSGASRLQCALRPNALASDLPQHVCAEPVCAYHFNVVGFGGGVCDVGELRACTEDGTLGDAAACPAGLCRSLAVSPQADGRVPGMCDAAVRCAEGEERCVDDGLMATPLFQRCVEGEWESAVSTCPDDGLCLDWVDFEGMSHKLCDAECVPGRHRCNDSGSLETCGDDGTWGDETPCTLGRCQATGNNDAACVLDCAPGETLCTGSTVLASDNASAGTTAEIVCTADGTLSGAPTTCAAGESCRTSATGVVLGCVECLGPNAPGGNAVGLVDSRCTPGESDSVQSCDADNTWGAGRTCGGGKTCVGASGPRCGTCLSATGNSVVCTETNIADVEVCGACDVAASDGGTGITIPVCRQSAIQAIDSGASCNSLFDGAAVSWGGYADCCDGDGGAYLQTTSLTCGSLGYGLAGAWGGEPDCCSAYQQPAGGPAFAYCAE